MHGIKDTLCVWYNNTNSSINDISDIFCYTQKYTKKTVETLTKWCDAVVASGCYS